MTRLAAGVLAISCTLGAGASAVGGVAALADTRDAQAAADATEIIQIRSGLRRVHLAEVNTMVLRQFGALDDEALANAQEERRRTRAEAVAALERISDRDGPTGLEAVSLLEVLDDDGLADATAAPPMTIIETSWRTTYEFRPPDSALLDRTRALYDLMITDVTGAGILNDGLDAEYVLRSPDLSADLVPYFAESEDYLRTNGGYLGPSEREPLTDSYVYQPKADQPHPSIETVSDLVVASDLWTFDQWIRSWQEATPTEAAPFDLDELVNRTSELDRAVYAVVDEALRVELEERTADASSAQARAMVFLGLAALLILVPIGLLAQTIRRRFHAVTQVVAQVAIDPLTGAGNRHLLRTDTEAHVANTAHTWHLVAAIDMDRFKMINDTWGHAVGDQVLIEVARRLTKVTDGWRGSASGTAGTVVRLGGDEFLLTLHAPSHVNVDIVREQLDEIRNSSIIVTRKGEPEHALQLSFSMGIATADSPVALDDLMRIADLAAYEEKAQRARALPDRRRPVVAPESLVRPESY